MDPQFAEALLEITKIALDAKSHLEKGKQLLHSNPKEAILEFEKGLEIVKSYDDESKELRQTNLLFATGLSQAYSKIGQHDLALINFKKCLKLSELLNRNEDFAISMYHVGLCLYHLKEFKESLEYCEKALPLVRKHIPNTLIDVLSLMVTLYSKFAEKHEDGLKIIDETKKLTEARYGKNSKQYVKILCGKGNFLAAAERHNEVIPILVEALELRKKLVEDKNSEYALMVKNLGESYAAIEEFEKGFKYLSEALELFERIDPTQEISATCLVSMAKICEKTEQYETSLKMRKKALAILIPIHGKNNIQVAVILQRYACNLYKLNRYSEALKTFDEVIEIFRSPDLSKQPIVNDFLFSAFMMKSYSLAKTGKRKEALSFLESNVPAPKEPEEIREIEKLKKFLGTLEGDIVQIQEQGKVREGSKQEIRETPQQIKKEEVESKCQICGKPTTNRCASCQKVYYCGRDCQRSDWKEHKTKCKSK